MAAAVYTGGGMIESNPNPMEKSGDIDAAGRLVLALGASVALHLALMFGVHVKAIQQAGGPRPALAVRIEHAAPGGEGAAALSAALPSGPVQVEETAPAGSENDEPQPVAAASPAAEQAATVLPAVEIPLLEDPTWYPARQVDAHPAPLYPVKPDYPDKGAEQGAEGSVVVLLLIDEAGVVRDVSVVEADPEGVFEESALQAFRAARFTPAQKNGRAVKSRVLIRVTYELLRRAKPVMGQPPLPAAP